MNTSTNKERLPEIARAAAEPTARGALLRRRIVAIGGFALLVAGFLFAIGAGLLVAMIVVLGAVGGIGFVVVRRFREGVHLDLRGKVGAATQRPLEDIRRRRRHAAEERGEANRQREQVSRLNARGAELRKADQAAEAIEAHLAALELVRSMDDPSAEALTLNNLALAYGHAGQEQDAIELFDEAAAILRRIDDEHHEGQVLANLGLLHGRGGRHEQAVYCLEAALDKLDRRSTAFRRVEEQLRRAS